MHYSYVNAREYFLGIYPCISWALDETLQGVGAGEGNRTLVVSLGSFCSAIELHPQQGDFISHRPLPASARQDRSLVFCCGTMTSVTITGELATGLGQATGFTQLDWAHEAFLSRLDINAYPGTVNMLLRDDAQRAQWRTAKSWPGIIIPPPRPDWCNSRCYLARIAGAIDAAIVLPEIESYPVDQIELIASVNVRDALGIADGDPLSIEVRDV